MCSSNFRHDNCTFMSLKCGHRVPCITNIETYVCKSSRNVTLSCGHQIGVPCVEEPEVDVLQCSNMVVCNLRCGHEEDVSCSTAALLNNGTIDEMQYPFCTKKCEAKLDCTHSCPGVCGNCSMFQIHDMCKITVTKSSLCGHHIETACGSPPVFCREKCKIKCSHNACPNPCNYSCLKCQSTCNWQCSHKKCHKFCYKLCDRTPCDVACTTVLPCGHICGGYCGEPCLPICVKCEDDYSSLKRYILLEDCSHVIEINELTDHFDNQSSECFISCPKCNTVVTRNRRFGDIVKEKRQEYHHTRNQNWKNLMAWDRSEKINYELSAKMVNMKIDPSFSSNILKMEINHELIDSVRVAYDDKEKNISACDFKYLTKLFTWIQNHRFNVAVQQIEECSRAVRRVIFLYVIRYTLQPKFEDIHDLLERLICLLRVWPFSKNNELKFIDCVKELEESVVKNTILDFIENVISLQKNFNYFSFKSDLIKFKRCVYRAK